MGETMTRILPIALFVIAALLPAACGTAENKNADSLACVGDACNASCGADCETREPGDDGHGDRVGEDESREETRGCVPDCDGRECGEDGCGASCGECPAAAPLCEEGTCVPDCQPDCEGRECGNDGCDGSCGECPENHLCLESGECLCQPACDGKECGTDGCDGTCGTCEGQQESCVEGLCHCEPACEGKECGNDGCDGSCGQCPDSYQCLEEGNCICVPDCNGKECGGDGCTGLCGTCGCGENCTLEGLCFFTACSGKECGSDGCGSSCGSCPGGQYCVLGSCPPGDEECFDGNETNWDGCTADELSEFLVNGNVDGDQEAPAAAVLAEGGFVIAWESGGQDGNGPGVFARRFSASGWPAGEEFQVNIFINGAQSGPALCGLEGGGFLVTWTSAGQDGFLDGVFARQYGADGTPAGEEFQVNQITDFNQNRPVAAGLPGGGFEISWQSDAKDGSEAAVVGRRFDALGVPEDTEFVINTYILGNQNAPALTVFDDGRQVALWGSFQQDGNDWGVFAQRFDVQGLKSGVEFQVNTHNSKHQYWPAGAVQNASDFVAVWQSFGQDGDEYGIYGQRFGANNKAGEEFQVSATDAGTQEYPVVAATTGGAFAAAWQSCPSISSGAPGQDGSECGIYLRVFSKKAVPAGSELLVHEFTDGSQAHPSMASFDDGSLLVAWQSCPPALTPDTSQDGSGCGVFARRFTKSGEDVYH